MNRLFVAAALLATSAFGITVTVPNPSFEIATLPFSFPVGSLNNLVGSGSVPLGGTLANWSAIGAQTGDNVGAFDPNNTNANNWTAVWETGNNVGYIQNRATGTVSAGLSQVLGDAYQANTAYALTVDIGRRNFSLGPMGYSIELWAGGTLVGTASNLSLPLNSAGTDTLNVFINAGDAAVGQAIEVRLLSNGVFSETYFDNVRLDATAAPEPASVILMGAALVAVGALRHRRSGAGA